VKTASLKELKTELSDMHPSQLVDLCMQLVKYKKENKELLTYLLFEASDETSYVNSVKDQMSELFEDVNRTNLYLAKKTIRKILKTTNKYIKYSGNKQTEVELLLFFCLKLRKTGISMPANTALGNLYLRQYQKLNKALSSLHEDLQYDYEDKIKLL
jgi:hypothetical protein